MNYPFKNNGSIALKKEIALFQQCQDIPCFFCFFWGGGLFLGQSISATVRLLLRWLTWITKEQQKGLLKLKRVAWTEHWKTCRSVWGWILRAHRGPHGVRHKGSISCSQHKQNGYRSSSVTVTYQFSHFTDFLTLRIMAGPRVLRFKGISRSAYHKSELFEIT